jgi:hypothetical protein
MTPIHFPEANVDMKGDHLEISGEKVGNLPVYSGQDQFVSCWKMSWRERVHALLHGTCWLQLYTDQFPPVSLTAGATIFTKEG